MLGQVDHDPFTHPGRQQTLTRDEDLGAGARQPRVDALVDAQQFLVTEAVLASELDQRVLVAGLDALDLAEQPTTIVTQWVLACLRRRYAERRQAQQDQRQHPPSDLFDTAHAGILANSTAPPSAGQSQSASRTARTSSADRLNTISRSRP